MSQVIKILIVDDQRMLRILIRKYLESQPDMVVVGEAENGVECLGMLASTNPDIIIMDLQMPKKTGFMTLKEMRNNAILTPVIILSSISESNPVMEQELRMIGAFEVLQKPEGGQLDHTLASTIRRAFQA